MGWEKRSQARSSAQFERDSPLRPDHPHSRECDASLPWSELRWVPKVPTFRSWSRIIGRAIHGPGVESRKKKIRK